MQRSSTPTRGSEHQLPMDSFAGLDDTRNTNSDRELSSMMRKASLRSWHSEQASDKSSELEKEAKRTEYILKSETRYSKKYVKHALGPVRIVLYGQNPPIPATYEPVDSTDDESSEQCKYRLNTVENLLKEMLNFFCSDDYYKNMKDDVLKFWKVEESLSENFGSVALANDISGLRSKNLAHSEYIYQMHKLPHVTKSHHFQQNIVNTYLKELLQAKDDVAVPRHGSAAYVKRAHILQLDSKLHERLNNMLFYIFLNLYDVNMRYDGSNNMSFTTHEGRITHHTKPDMLVRDELDSIPCIPIEVCGSMESTFDELPNKATQSRGGQSGSTLPTSVPEYYYKEPSTKDSTEENVVFLSDEGSTILPDSIAKLELHDHQLDYIKRKLYGQLIFHLLGCIANANQSQAKPRSDDVGRTVFRPRNECWGFFIIHEIAIPVKLVCPTEYIDLFLAANSRGRHIGYNMEAQSAEKPVYSVMNWHLDLSKQICRRAFACLLKFHHQTAVYRLDSRPKSCRW